MIDPFGERRFPGDCRPPSHYASGPWEDFEPAPGVDCLLKCRTLYRGQSAQFGGYLYDTIPADHVVVLGVLDPTFRPSAPKRFILAIDAGRYNAWGDLGIESDGAVVLRPRVTLSDATFRVVYALLGRKMYFASSSKAQN